MLTLTASSSEIVVLNVANKLNSGKEFTEQLQLNLGGHTPLHHLLWANLLKQLWAQRCKTFLTAQTLWLSTFRNQQSTLKGYGITKEALVNIESTISENNNAEWVINLVNPYSINANWKGISEKCSSLLVAYQDDYRTQEGVADAIVGIGGAKGKLPVTPPGSGYGFGGLLE